MDARRRQKILRIAELASKHPSCAGAVGINVSTQRREGRAESKLSVPPMKPYTNNHKENQA